MQKSQIQKSNINKTINKIIITSIIISLSMIAIMIGINYLNHSNFNLSQIGHNVNWMLFSTVSAFILNVILMYQAVKDIKRNKHIIINPGYATIATVFLNILFVATITTMSMFLNQSQSLIENITNNIVTAISITFFAILGLAIFNLETGVDVSVPEALLIVLNTIMGTIMTTQRFEVINHLVKSQKYTASNITITIFSSIYLLMSGIAILLLIAGILIAIFDPDEKNTK